MIVTVETSSICMTVLQIWILTILVVRSWSLDVMLGQFTSKFVKYTSFFGDSNRIRNCIIESHWSWALNTQHLSRSTVTYPVKIKKTYTCDVILQTAQDRRNRTVAAFFLAAWCVFSANLPSLNTLKSCKTKTNPNLEILYFREPQNLVHTKII